MVNVDKMKKDRWKRTIMLLNNELEKVDPSLHYTVPKRPRDGGGDERSSKRRRSHSHHHRHHRH